jgi:hypothetical protein
MVSVERADQVSRGLMRRKVPWRGRKLNYKKKKAGINAHLKSMQNKFKSRNFGEIDIKMQG